MTDCIGYFPLGYLQRITQILKIALRRHCTLRNSSPTEDPNGDAKMELHSTVIDKWSSSTPPANTMRRRQELAPPSCSSSSPLTRPHAARRPHHCLPPTRLIASVQTQTSSASSATALSPSSHAPPPRRGRAGRMVSCIAHGHGWGALRVGVLVALLLLGHGHGGHEGGHPPDGALCHRRAAAAPCRHAARHLRCRAQQEKKCECVRRCRSGPWRHRWEEADAGRIAAKKNESHLGYSVGDSVFFHPF
jgi:hypothetical protein